LFVLRAVADDGAAAGGELGWLAVGGLGAYAEEWRGPREVTREGMLEHHRVVSRVHERVDCLPVRFPTWAEDETAAERLVDARAEALRMALERVRGKSELAVTLVWEEALAREPAAGGRDYMEKKRVYWAARREREAAAREWASQLGPDVLVKVCPNDQVAVSAAVLVPRGRADEAALSLPPALDGTRCVINGPWPPYSFATVE
jgi:hypothetical protein